MNARCVTCPLAAICMSLTCVAQDRHFAWTYESVTLPKGGLDIEPWITYSTGRVNYFTQLTTRLEFEFGVTNHLQTAFYFNGKHSAEATVDSTSNINGLLKKSGFSISNEWKVSILDPSSRPIGLGLYGEYTLYAHEVELEFKLLLDKKLPKDVIAFNHVWEFEFEKEFESEAGQGMISTGKEVIMENDLAWNHLFSPSFGLGVELRNHNIIDGGSVEHSTLSGGPSLFWSHTNESGPGIFLIFSPLWQLASLVPATTGALELTEHQRFDGRLLLGLTF